MSRRARIVIFAALAAVVVVGVAVLTLLLGRTRPDAQLGPVGLREVIFYFLAGLAVAGAAGVALSRNILNSAVGLLMALLGAGSLYVFLSADFVAVIQLLVYIGGVLVLVLFAVMLTQQIGDVHVSNVSLGFPGGLALFAAVAPLLVWVARSTPWAVQAYPKTFETTAPIGDAFLSQWLLPFELASLILLATLIGAVVIARKELKAD